MTTTLTTNKGLNVIGVTDPGWGPPTNENVTNLDQILGSPVAIAATSGTTALTLAQCRYNTLRFTGALGANARYNIPTGVSGEFMVINDTTGAGELRIGHADGGTTVLIPQGASFAVYGSSSAGVGGVRLVDTPVSSSSADTQVLVNTGGAIVGSDDLIYSLALGLRAVRENSATDTVSPTLVASRSTSGGSPDIGIGGGVQVEVEVASGDITSAMLLGAEATAVGSGTSSFDFVVKLKNVGLTLAEKFRVTSTGIVQGVSIAGDWVATNAQATAGALNTVIMTPLRTKQAIEAKFNAATSAEIDIASGTLKSFAHGLGTAPNLISVRLVCQAADAGFSAGDVIFPAVNSTSDTSGGSGDRQNAVYIPSGNTTHVYVRFSDAAECFATGAKGSGANTALTNSKWKLKITAVVFN